MLADNLVQLGCTPLIAQVDGTGGIYDHMREFTVALVLRHCCEIAPVLPGSTEFLVPQLQVFSIIRLVESVDVLVGIIQNRSRGMLLPET